MKCSQLYRVYKSPDVPGPPVVLQRSNAEGVGARQMCLFLQSLSLFSLFLEVSGEDEVSEALKFLLGESIS